MSTSKVYWVQLSRPIIQTTLMRVEAASEMAAAEFAIDHASEVPETDWQGTYDRDKYVYDVDGMLASEDMELGAAPEDALSFIEHRYILLKADTASGEGAMLVQPWISGISSMMLADISQDWLTEIERLHDEGVEGLVEWMEARALDASDIRANVSRYLLTLSRKSKGNRGQP